MTVRFVVRVLGRVVLDVEVDTAQPDPDGDLAPPFGFSGSGGGQAERADTGLLEDSAPEKRAVGR